LPLKITFARLLDLPLLVTIYFALVRQDKIFGIGWVTALDYWRMLLLTAHRNLWMASGDRLSLAASAALSSTSSDSFALWWLASNFPSHYPPSRASCEVCSIGTAFVPLDLLVSVMVNVGLGLVLFNSSTIQAAGVGAEKQAE